MIYIGMQATTQEIVPTNSQEFSTLLPRYHLFVINIQMMCFSQRIYYCTRFCTLIIHR